MKKNLLIAVFTLLTISFFASGCAEPRYYRNYHHHSERFYHHRHMPPPPGIDYHGR